MEHLDFFVNNVPHCGAWVRDFEFVQVREGEVPPQALRLSYGQAQELMDRLYAAGLRPTEQRDRAGVLAATECHLQDMRRLVFEKPSL